VSKGIKVFLSLVAGAKNNADNLADLACEDVTCSILVLEQVI